MRVTDISPVFHLCRTKGLVGSDFKIILWSRVIKTVPLASFETDLLALERSKVYHFVVNTPR